MDVVILETHIDWNATFVLLSPSTRGKGCVHTAAKDQTLPSKERRHSQKFF